MKDLDRYLDRATRGLPFREATFDAVVSGLALNFVPRPERAIAEFARVAAPGAVGDGGGAVADFDFYAFDGLAGQVFEVAVTTPGTQPPSRSPWCGERPSSSSAKRSTVLFPEPA